MGETQPAPGGEARRVGPEVSESRGLLHAPGLRADFTAQGATVGPARGARWAFQATPRSFGCDAMPAAVGSALPEVRAGRVEYARPELREWYAESPRGLEQGFTLAAPPACRRDGGRGGVIALGGGLGAVVSADGRAARLHPAGGGAGLRYTDLHVIDAAGRELPARLEAQGEALAIRFDDAGARYPVEVDPVFWAVQQELDPNDGSVDDQFGSAVALSGDTAVVSSPYVNSEGGVYVFVRSGQSWLQQERLSVGNISTTVELGLSVSVSGDTALIGSVGQDFGTGVANFFVRSGASWIQQQPVLAPSPVTGAHFGSAVVVAGDTALVGQANTGAGPFGAFVYVRSGTTWALQQALTDGAPADAGEGDGFGSSLALSGDTALVGAPGALGGMGAAYVFVRSGTTWTLQQELVAPDGEAYDGFGTALAVEGDTAVVGAPNRLSSQGGIYVWNRSGSTWVETQLITPVAPITNVGAAVALSGGTVAVGGYDEQTGGGLVSIYAPSGTTLALQQVLSPPESQPGDAFGAGVALDGTTLVAGAPGYANMEGAAFAFTLGATAGDPCTAAETCSSGHCVDGVCCTVAACAAAGPCNAAETCLPGTGTCSLTPLNEGVACTGAVCTQDGVCHDGACTTDPIVCAPADECHEFGTCDPTSGACESPAKADGQPCAGGTCMSGACAPMSPSGSGSAGGGSTGGCGCRLSGGSGAGAGLGAVLALLALARGRARRFPFTRRRPTAST